jgi:soluble lytic murein transglycosylase-like protein
LLGGAKYLSQQLKAFKNESTALAAYNAGPTRVRRGNTLPTETRSYVKRVLAVRNILASRRKYTCIIYIVFNSIA